MLGIALVFGLAGWRLFFGEAEKVTIARLVVPPAKLAAASEPTETTASQKQDDLTQQLLVDDLQSLEGRVAKQDAEIRRLKASLEQLSQKYDTLMSFASTAKEAKPVPVAQPVRKVRKRVAKLAKKT